MYCPLSLHQLITGEKNVSPYSELLSSVNSLAVPPATVTPTKAPTPPQMPELKRILYELCMGVKHLHDLNIVHRYVCSSAVVNHTLRDLKPQNILLDSTNHIKISDMGLAKKLVSESHSFSTGATGTPGWQPPEVISDLNTRKTKSVCHQNFT